MAAQRLIDVGENSICDGCNWEPCEGSPSENNRCYAKRWIDEQPTVDAKPVVHGHWIKHEYAEEVDGHLIPNYECSNCHSWLRDNRDYCGDCGAKMNEEDGERE